MIQFNIDLDGKWIVTKHVAKHNHPLGSSNKRYLLPSHRKVSSEDLMFVKELKDARIGVVDAFCSLIKLAGGAPFVDFQLNDLYNMLGK